MIRYAKVERDTTEPPSLLDPESRADLAKAVAEAPNLVWLDAHVNDSTGEIFSGWLTSAPVGLYTTTCVNGDIATITNLDSLFSVR